MPALADLFVPMLCDASLPDKFPSPFDVVPHAIAQQAAESLKSQLKGLCPSNHNFSNDDGGKMFGVLVVKNTAGEIGYLAAYSGMLGGQWKNEGFVPPVFDELARQKTLHTGETEIAGLTRQCAQVENDQEYKDAQFTAEQFQRLADQKIHAMKQLHESRKLARHAIRNECNKLADSEVPELEALANQSRQDKFAFRSLKAELKSDEQKSCEKWNLYQVKLAELKKARKKLSARLQADLFNGYELLSVDGNSLLIRELFADGLPPSGAGDCAATKLVQYANVNNLIPIALAEFWWGSAPRGSFRKHGRYYPSCRSRCRVVLPFMLSGLEVTIPLHEQPVHFGKEYPRTLHEDEDIVVVEKPAGLLSVPGKVLADSVEQRLKARYPEVTGVMLLHRLDQATSGVMIAARNARAYKSLQHQFQDRTVSKKYIAVLDGILTQDEGEIELPLRIDYYDRPRQIVCHERGKPSLTLYSVISRDSNTTRVAFYPHTGRTHQLRVHAAHPQGLDCPILGDELYGRTADRLYLHAAQLTITHPLNDVRMAFSSEVSF